MGLMSIYLNENEKNILFLSDQLLYEAKEIGTKQVVQTHLSEVI